MPTHAQMGIRDLVRGAPAPAGRDGTDRVRAELARLDPWSFWVVPGDVKAAELIVLGTTGTFLVRACEWRGVVSGGPRRITIDDRPVPGLAGMRRSARRLRSRLNLSAVHTEVDPLLCLTRATAGAARTVGGVRIVPVADLVKEITAREKVLLPSRAERGAKLLGHSSAGAPTRDLGPST